MTKLEKILDEIVKHVRWTGDIILSADNPTAFPPKVGWCNEMGTRSWSTSVRHLRQDLDVIQDQTKAALLRKYVITSTGRMTIARSIPGQRENMTSSPVFECPRCRSRTWDSGFSADMHPKEECDERLISSVQES